MEEECLLLGVMQLRDSRWARKGSFLRPAIDFLMSGCKAAWPTGLVGGVARLSSRKPRSGYPGPIYPARLRQAKEINPNAGGIRTAEERAILFGQTAASVQAAV